MAPGEHRAFGAWASGHPIRFSLLVYLGLWALAFGCRLALPGSSLEERAQVFQALAALLSIGLLALLGWWRRVGFRQPRDLHLVLVPVVFLILAPMLGGVELPQPAAVGSLVLGVAITAWSEEVLFRGIAWHALLPTGLPRAVALTSVLFGSLHLARVALGGSLEDVLPMAIATTLGGIGYAALRHRTGSIWPVIAFHAAFNLTGDITHPERVPGLILFLSVAVTLGLAAYGLLLLRRPAAALADAGL